MVKAAERSAAFTFTADLQNTVKSDIIIYAKKFFITVTFHTGSANVLYERSILQIIKEE